MLESTDGRLFCNICSHSGAIVSRRRFMSVDDLVARTALRRDELVTLADIGALNAFGYDRRSALWQAERAVRPAGELFATPNYSLSSEPIGDWDDSPSFFNPPGAPPPGAGPLASLPKPQARFNP